MKYNMHTIYGIFISSETNDVHGIGKINRDTLNKCVDIEWGFGIFEVNVKKVSTLISVASFNETNGRV